MVFLFFSYEETSIFLWLGKKNPRDGFPTTVFRVIPSARDDQAFLQNVGEPRNAKEMPSEPVGKVESYLSW